MTAERELRRPIIEQDARRICDGCAIVVAGARANREGSIQAGSRPFREGGGQLGGCLVGLGDKGVDGLPLAGSCSGAIFQT